jgi:protein O-GlcNAc transferase
MNPNEDAEASHQLGLALAQQGKVAEAIVHFRRAVELRPDAAVFQNNLGLALTSADQLPEAVAALQRAIELRPDYADAYANLGNALTQQRKFEPSVEAYQKAIALRPDFGQAWSNLSMPLMYLKRHEESVAAARRGLALRPNSAISVYNLGAALDGAGEWDEALEQFRRALQLRPDFVQSQFGIGNVMKGMGRIDEAVAAYRHALGMSSDALAAMSNLAFTVHFHPDYDAAAILRTQREWNAAFAAPIAGQIKPHNNDPTPDRRIRVGYISPDLRDHPVGRGILPILEHHDAARFEIFCYSDCPIQDRVTSRLRASAETWREISGWHDADVAEQIRKDRIDILVDLALQTAGNRLLVFAQKPAPIQATYLAYCSTSGMDAMDWRITDPWFDPPGGDESGYSEASMRVPQSYWFYEPPTREEPPAEAPAVANGFVTFGSQSNYSKLTAPVWDAWIEILRRSPNSKLLVYAPGGSPRDTARKRLVDAGVDPNRLRFSNATGQDYFRGYRQIDITLDPFPYGGGMTTCDAIWMGSPVVTWRGRTAVGRGGVSILSNLGLPELIGENVGQYIQIAVELADDLPRLTRVRHNLRQRMQNSPLMDAPAFARGIEGALIKMWENWCQSRR